MNPGLLAHHMTLGKVEANAIRQSRGVGPIGGGAPLAPATSGGSGCSSSCSCRHSGWRPWTCSSSSGCRCWGGGISFLDCVEVVCVEPTALPPGHFQLGDVALVPGLPGVSDGSLVRRVPTNEVANYKLSDLRVLPIQFDPQGNRRREFSQAVSNLVDGVPQGGGLQLEGPATCLNIAKSLRDQNLTPTTFHEYWLRSAEIPKGDRSVYEHECLSRILESMITVDQLNICALQGAELICRRMQVIREAHRVSPSAPDYSSADHFMGWKWRRGAHEVDATLAAHVANELKNESQIMKEARNAREEAQTAAVTQGTKILGEVANRNEQFCSILWCGAVGWSEWIRRNG